MILIVMKGTPSLNASKNFTIHERFSPYSMLPLPSSPYWQGVQHSQHWCTVLLSLLHWWVKHRPWRGAILPSLLAWSFIMPSLFLIPKYCSASLHVYWPVCCRGISCQNLIVGMISVIFMQAQKFNPDGKLFYITKFIIKCCCCYIFFLNMHTGCTYCALYIFDSSTPWYTYYKVLILMLCTVVVDPGVI